MEKALGRYTPAKPRAKRVVLTIDDEPVIIRDQAPLLLKGQMDLASGFALTDLTTLIDKHVFFWPGNADEMRSGLWESSKYAEDNVVMIRVSLAALLRENPGVGPFFCKFNSGGPRATGGRPSPRGPDLFVGAAHFDGTPSTVIEVAFRRSVRLPADVDLAEGLNAPFRPFKVRPAIETG